MPELAYDAVWINGSVGSGKTTAADRLGSELERRGVPGGVIDVDTLRRAWPAPAHDPFNARLALENVRAVAANLRASGARIVVAAGVIEDVGQHADSARALGARRMLHVRLSVDPARAAARLRARHGDDADELAWHLARHPELARILDRAGFPDELVLDTTDLTPERAGERIADALLERPRA